MYAQRSPVGVAGAAQKCSASLRQHRTRVQLGLARSKRDAKIAVRSMIAQHPFEALSAPLRIFTPAGLENVMDWSLPKPRIRHPDRLRNGLEEVLTSLALTEAIYRVVTDGPHSAGAYFERLLAELNVSPTAVAPIWWSGDDGGQRYCRVETDDTLYVGIMGSITLSDWQANFNVLLTDIWHPNAAASERPAAHRGYLGRSQHIPVEELYALARSCGKRLILCGHSLGGAVASLCALRLLQQLPQAEAANVSALGFASPAVGNQALARAVQQANWQDCFATFLLPEDYVPRLLNPLRRIRLPDSPSLLAVACLQRRQPQAQWTASNIQPFVRRPAARQRAATPKAASHPAKPARAAVAHTQQHLSAVAPNQRWHTWLLGGIVGAALAAARLAGSPLRAAKTYVPFGHEVFLISPTAGSSLHAAVLKGMHRSLVCPDAHRMPSYRARILDIIHASAECTATAMPAAELPIATSGLLGLVAGLRAILRRLAEVVVAGELNTSVINVQRLEVVP